MKNLVASVGANSGSGQRVNFTAMRRISDCSAENPLSIAAERERRTLAPEVSNGRLMQRMLAQLRADEVSVEASRKARSVAFDLADKVTFAGVLKPIDKSTNTAKIDCDDTRTLFSRDVLVNEAQCEGLPVGQIVSFRIQLRGGQPQAWDVAWPPVLPSLEAVQSDAVQDRPSTSRSEVSATTTASDRSRMSALLAHDELSTKGGYSGPPRDLNEGMHGLLAHRDLQPEPVLNNAARTWKSGETKSMHALMAHNDGHGRTANGWKPSLEADDRHFMANLMKHKENPEVFPYPVVREGAFVGWTSN